jgi:hypothetical protein
MTSDLSEMLRAIGRHLVATCPRHVRQADPERSWLRRPSAEPCAACRDLQAALGLEPSPVETSA